MRCIKNRINNIIKGSKAGESYVDACISIVTIMMVFAVGLNIINFVVMRQHMDEMATQLVKVASFNGEFGDEFNTLANKIEDEYGYTVEVSSERYYNTVDKQVQIGDFMYVTVINDTYLEGIGGISIPFKVQIRKSGISEHYWKG